jgi:hypothetical protein
MDLKLIVYGAGWGVNRTHADQNRDPGRNLVNTAMKLNFP